MDYLENSVHSVQSPHLSFCFQAPVFKSISVLEQWVFNKYLEGHQAWMFWEHLPRYTGLHVFSWTLKQIFFFSENIIKEKPKNLQRTVEPEQLFCLIKSIFFSRLEKFSYHWKTLVIFFVVWNNYFLVFEKQIIIVSLVGYVSLKRTKLVDFENVIVLICWRVCWNMQYLVIFVALFLF